VPSPDEPEDSSSLDLSGLAGDEVKPQIADPEESPPSAYVAPPISPERPRTRADLPVNYRTILAMALPTLIEQMVTFGVRATDIAVAGRTGVDDAARAASAAAVGAMTYLQWFAAMTSAAIGVGATAIVARSIGAKRPRLANRVAGTACSAAFLVSSCVAALFFLFPGVATGFLHLHGEVEVLARQYLQIMLFTICFQSLSLIGNACLRGAGDTLRPMISTITASAITIVAVPALSFGWFGLPALGIQGNALGTLMAFFASALMTIFFLRSGSAGLKLRRSHFKVIPHMLTRILRIGLPSGVENSLIWIGQVFIVRMATMSTDKALGTNGTTFAAHHATITIESLAFLPGFGLGIACAALVGQYLGAKKPEEAAQAVKLCQRLALISMTVIAATYVFFPAYMLGLMVQSDAVIALGTVPLILAGLAQPGFAVQIIKSAALRGAGDTVSPMIVVLSGICLRVIFVYSLLTVLGRYDLAHYGLTAVWVAIFLDLNYRGFCNHMVYRRGKWKTQEV